MIELLLLALMLIGADKAGIQVNVEVEVAVDVEPIGATDAFACRSWYWTPRPYKCGHSSLSDDDECCVSPGRLRSNGQVVNSTTSCVLDIASNPSEAAFLCGWDARDFDTSGCYDGCLAALGAGGYPAPGVPNRPSGGSIGIDCCVRAPLTTPRPLISDVGRCHATR